MRIASSCSSFVVSNIINTAKWTATTVMLDQNDINSDIENGFLVLLIAFVPKIHQPPFTNFCERRCLGYLLGNGYISLIFFFIIWGKCKMTLSDKETEKKHCMSTLHRQFRGFFSWLIYSWYDNVNIFECPISEIYSRNKVMSVWLILSFSRQIQLTLFSKNHKSINNFI